MTLEQYARSLAFYDLDSGYQPENGAPTHDSSGHVPTMSALNALEPGRMERLGSTWRYAQATAERLSERYRARWDGAIAALRDEKGTLLVTWRDELSRVMFEGIILGAWEASGEHAHAHGLLSR